MVQFTDTLGGTGANLAESPVVEPTDTSFQQITNTVAAIGNAALSSSGKGSGISQNEVQRNVNESVFSAFQKEMGGVDQFIAEAQAASEQGSSSRVEQLTRANQFKQRIIAQNPRFAAEITKSFETLLGADPTRELEDINQKLVDDSIDQQVRFENSLQDAALKGELAFEFDNDGNIDYDGMASQAFTLNSLVAEANQTTKINAAFNDKHKLQIQSYVGKVSTSIMQVSDDANLVSKTPERDRKFYQIMSELRGGALISPDKERFARQWVANRSVEMRNSFVGNLRQPLSPDNQKILTDNINEAFAGPLEAMIDAGSVSSNANGDYLATVTALSRISELEEKENIFQKIPQMKKLGAIKDIVGENNLNSILGSTSSVQSLDTLSEMVNSMVENQEKTPTELDNLEERVQSSEKYLQITNTSEKTFGLDGEVKDFAMANYKIMEPVSSVSDINRVLETVSAPTAMKNFVTFAGKVQPGEEKAALTSSIEKQLTRLGTFISGELEEKSGLAELMRQDVDSGVIFLETAEGDIQPQVFPIGPSAASVETTGVVSLQTVGSNKFVTAANSYLVLSAMYNQLTGADVTSIKNIIPDVQTSSLSAAGRKVTGGGIVVNEGRAYLFPENKLHNNMLGQEWESLRKSQSKSGSVGGIFGGLASGLGLPNIQAPQGSEDPVGDIIAQTGNDELGNLIADNNLQGEQQVDIIDRVIEREGGFVNDPVDRGGATNFGITKKTLKEFRGENVSVDDVKNLSKEEAREIYTEEFLRKPGIDKLPADIQEFVFDFAVNSGPSNAIKQLQRVAGVTADGIIGPQTIAAAENVSLGQLVQARLGFIADLVKRKPEQSKFLRGWVNRITEFLV